MPRKRNTQIIFTQLGVTNTAARGKAIAHAPDGKVILIDHAVPGDIVDVQTYKKRKAYYQARVIHVHKRSDKRTSAPCQHFTICGGCKWQDMAYHHQLTYKQQEVIDNLARIGTIKLPEVLPIVGSKQSYFYRNKMDRLQ